MTKAPLLCLKNDAGKNLVGAESFCLFAFFSTGQYRPATIIAATGIVVGVTLDIQGDLIHRKGPQPSIVNPGDEPAAVRLTLPGLATTQLDPCCIVNNTHIAPR